MNLKHFAAEAASENETATVPLTDAKGEPYLTAKGEPVTASVLGEYSPAVRRAQVANRRRALQVAPTNPDEPIVAVAVAALKAWNLEDADGQPIPLTPENARAVFEIAPWLLEQVVVGMRAHASFFTRGSAN